MNSSKASRRFVIATAAALPALGAANVANTAATAATNPDARLIALGTRLRANIAERDRIAEPYLRASRFVHYAPEDDARMSALREELDFARCRPLPTQPPHTSARYGVVWW